MADTTTIPCTVVDPEERARVLERVYRLLLQAAHEESAAREARNQSGTAEVGISALEPGTEEVYHRAATESKAGCDARKAGAARDADASHEPQTTDLPLVSKLACCEGASHGTPE